MKAYKLEVLMLDHDELGVESVVSEIECVKYFSPSVMKVEDRDIGEWNDDHPLNSLALQEMEYEKLFADPVKSAINLDNYKTNSLIIVKLDPESLKTQEGIDGVRRNLADIKAKWLLDDSVAIWATSETVELEALDENEMKSLGWVRK